MDLSRLSQPQRQAVTTTEGAVLVLAGAGSGKTSVLTNRVAYLIEEKGIAPERILAITFTNKAAGEMRERIERLVSCDVNRMAISTFHSLCARFLRYDAEKLGYKGNFTIYDSADCLTIVKKALSEANIDSKRITPRACLSAISGAKNAVGKQKPEEYLADHYPVLAEEMKTVYHKYTDRLFAENAMDFDDLLLNMLRVLQEHEEARRFYAGRYQYILVDEYQDTNSVQYQLVKILGEKSGNVFAVGDDDQSIYAWRGADIRNILDFEKDYPNTTVIKLEENYRSHSKILDAANAVIQRAAERKSKTLWSARKEGALPRMYTAANEYAEAEFVCREIGKMAGNGKPYADMAVLYRTHTQSRVLEEKLRAFGIPYSIFGGMSFYERMEIKDMVAFLTILDNPAADTALLRIINVPKRGIGDVTIGRLADFAAENGYTLIEAIGKADAFLSSGAVAKLHTFLDNYARMLDAVEGKTLGETVEEVFNLSGYHEMLALQDSTEAETRIENVEELINAAYAFEKNSEDASLGDFLGSISLISDMDTLAEEGSVTLMTLHSAKGLEFDTVFLVGMEENVFPSWRAIQEDKVDEERRLCYVGITRAKDTLYMTNCQSRNLYSNSNCNPPSRFIEDIPEHMLERLSPEAQAPRERPARAAAPHILRPQMEFKPKAKENYDCFRTGMNVRHKKFGVGQIKSIVGEGEQQIAVVAFESGDKKMFLAFAPLEIV